MPESVAAKAILPFFTTKGVGKGTGLGLSQVYGFAKASGGQLEIESRAAFGTTVRLYFPRIADASPPAKQRSNLMVRPASSGETVLVVEDDSLVRQVAVDGLKELGYTVLSAPDAAAALATLRSDVRIDVLFSDILMPGGMNGCQLAVEAKRIRPGIKVLLTTGYADEMFKARDIDPELPILEKPYRREDLLSKLSLVA
jgi:CheY-like chemotaxis protein